MSWYDDCKVWPILALVAFAMFLYILFDIETETENGRTSLAGEILTSFLYSWVLSAAYQTPIKR